VSSNAFPFCAGFNAGPTPFKTLRRRNLLVTPAETCIPRKLQPYLISRFQVQIPQAALPNRAWRLREFTDMVIVCQLFCLFVIDIEVVKRTFPDTNLARLNTMSAGTLT
jgi:hypothetical protein